MHTGSFQALFCALTLAGAVAVGCGDDTEEGTGTTASTTSGTPTGSGGDGATGGMGTGGMGTGGDGGMGTGGMATGGMGGGMGVGGAGVGGAGGGMGAEVESVDCNGIAPAATITGSNFMYTPADVTIAVGGVVMYVSGMGVHNMVSVPPGGFQSGPAGQNGCLKFNVAGAYPYQCGVHGASMGGTVTVQ